MLRMSKKMFYAIEAVLYLAYESGSEPVSGKDIAQRQGLPPRYLEQLMQQLVRAGILRGVRGPKGGYVLARERRRITVSEICDVVREMDALDMHEFQKTPLGRQIVYPLYQQMDEALARELGTLDMSSLCERADEVNVPRSKDNDADFVI